MSVSLTAEAESFALAQTFAISRGARTHAEVVTVTLRDGDLTGRGECVPYARYDETVDGVIARIEAQAKALSQGMGREELQQAMANGAARNALDCALWDLDAKRQSKAKGKPGSVRAWNVAGLPAPNPVRTVYTLALGGAEAMEEAAAKAAEAGRDRLKVKLGAGDGADDARLAAVRRGAPKASLIVDANEGWRDDELEAYLAAAREARVTMVEQPLRAGEDEALDRARKSGWLSDSDAALLLGADESVHTRRGLKALKGRYDVINIKLDKAGGLTEALSMASTARTLGFQVMVGCMMGTSLAMAPALMVAQRASHVDLDGPLWMARDREPGLTYDGQTVHPPEPDLWG